MFFDNFQCVFVTEREVDILLPAAEIHCEHILSCTSRHCADAARSTPTTSMPDLQLLVYFHYSCLNCFIYIYLDGYKYFRKKMYTPLEITHGIIFVHSVPESDAEKQKGLYRYKHTLKSVQNQIRNSVPILFHF